MAEEGNEQTLVGTAWLARGNTPLLGHCWLSQPANAYTQINATCDEPKVETVRYVGNDYGQ